MFKVFLSIFLVLLSNTAMAAKLSDYPSTGTLSDSAIIPIVQSSTNENVNWATLKNLNTAGINWSALPNAVQSGNINWQNLKTVASSLTGTNWQSLNNNGAGMNWQVLANGATSATIMCWKSNGQPGKCTTGSSGTTCTSCQ